MKIEVSGDINFGGNNKRPNVKTSGSKSLVRTRKLKNKYRVLFYRQLSSLIDAGVDLHNALLLLENDGKGKIGEMISGVRKNVEAGESFAEALRVTKYFSPFECESIRAAEESGKLNEVLKEMLNYYLFKQKLKRTVTGAISYPILLLIVAVGVIIFMLNVVVPMFKDIYRQLDRELPQITQSLILFADLFQEYLPFILGGTVIGFLLYKYLNKYDDWRFRFEQVYFSVPFIGRFYKNLIKSRICSLLNFLISAGVPLNKGLEHTASSIESVTYNRSLRKCVTQISSGSTLTETLGALEIFSQGDKMLIKLGEETNRLSGTFGQLSNSMNEQLEYEAGIMNKVLEPLLISIVAVFIAVILIALYLPLFNISF